MGAQGAIWRQIGRRPARVHVAGKAGGHGGGGGRLARGHRDAGVRLCDAPGRPASATAHLLVERGTGGAAARIEARLAPLLSRPSQVDGGRGGGALQGAPGETELPEGGDQGRQGEGLGGAPPVRGGRSLGASVPARNGQVAAMDAPGDQGDGSPGAARSPGHLLPCGRRVPGTPGVDDLRADPGDTGDRSGGVGGDPAPASGPTGPGAGRDSQQGLGPRNGGPGPEGEGALRAMPGEVTLPLGLEEGQAGPHPEGRRRRSGGVQVPADMLAGRDRQAVRAGDSGPSRLEPPWGCSE
ncbi:collagen alpha-1(III) chain-like [Ooceraea biroi]|uniref:collagen alpha-1(III) chain-like n=1 Tax=Ooceraea biroi TaxID=2015173 RepID=UPI000F094D96|nr:collagen alpha-1(III) chain-like [Ooceraea biroi]